MKGCGRGQPQFDQVVFFHLAVCVIVKVLLSVSHFLKVVCYVLVSVDFVKVKDVTLRESQKLKKIYGFEEGHMFLLIIVFERCYWNHHIDIYVCEKEIVVLDEREHFPSIQ